MKRGKEARKLEVEGEGGVNRSKLIVRGQPSPTLVCLSMQEMHTTKLNVFLQECRSNADFQICEC